MKQSNVRQHIVETASRLFYDNGYNLTGINQIIREADIAKATLYNHFRSKEDICLAYLVYKDEAFQKEIKQFVGKAPQGEEQILAVFDFLQHFFGQKDFNGCWCLNTISELPKEDERIGALIREQKQILLSWFVELVNENLATTNEEEASLVARQLYLLYEGALSESHLHQDSWPIQEAKLAFERLLTRE